MTIRIGQIDYANCTPIFTALSKAADCRDYRFIRGVPADLNRMLRSGEIDISPASSIEYAKSPDLYCLFPEISISSFGPVKSVLLFSRVPIDALDNCTIGLTSESETSINMLKIILAKSYGFTNQFVTTSLPLSEALVSFPALLLIGDRALKAARQPHEFNVYDLGELWYRFTGLPFVFALWIATRASVEQRPEEMRLLSRRLITAKKLAYEKYGEIAAGSAERSWMAGAELVEYWQTISYDLTPEHILGVGTFFRHAVELGLLAEEPEIRFFE